MADCDFHNPELKCPYCGYVSTNPNLRRNCSKRHGTKIENPQVIPQNGPDIVHKALNFSKAAISHFLNGSPTCSQEQIDERLKICAACPYFAKTSDNPLVGSCRHFGCGCNINNKKKYLNKLAWKDQKCPIDKWGPIED